MSRESHCFGFSPPLERLPRRNILSPAEAGDPGRGFRHRLIQSLIVGPAGALEQVEGMVTAIDDKKLDAFAETSAKRFQEFEIGQRIPRSLQE